MNVSFDFDGTLHRDGHPLWPSLALLRWHDQCGHRVIIVTTRTESHEEPEWWSIHEHNRVTIDAFLSRYRLPVGNVIFTEMPGVVVRVEKEDDRLGGAAAVAMLAAGFGAQVTLAGVVGDDEPGHRLRKLLNNHGIESHIWVDRRPTTWKQRIVTRGQLRPDRCDREVTTPVSDRAEQFLAEVPVGDILLISDYGKGVCTRGLLKMIGTRAREAHIPILVDPARSRNWADYGQVSLIKANWAEATEAASCENPRPLALARKLSDAHGCDVVVTLGRHGMVCAERPGPTWHLPATPTEVRDVCGAGDTVFAAIAQGIVTGKSLSEACQAAMGAAGIQVAKVGIAAAHAEPLRFDILLGQHRIAVPQSLAFSPQST